MPGRHAPVPDHLFLIRATNDIGIRYSHCFHAGRNGTLITSFFCILLLFIIITINVFYTQVTKSILATILASKALNSYDNFEYCITMRSLQNELHKSSSFVKFAENRFYKVNSQNLTSDN